MICSKCGNPNIKVGQKFCTKCGQPVTQSVPNQPSGSVSNMPSDPQKGLIDNVRHFQTFIQRGSQGVQREIRQAEEARLRQQAQQFGLEVNKPSTTPNNPNIPTPSLQSPRIKVDSESVEGVDIVQGRAIWNIHKGEIGRLITESEFANADGLKGIIVQEGCTALVFIDGQLISMMQAGVYTFPAKTEAEKQLEMRRKEIEVEQKALANRERQLNEEERKRDEEYAKTFRARGIFGCIAAFGRGVSNFLFGEKKGETQQQHRQRVERTVNKLGGLSTPKICRVYIVTNKIINLLFQSVEEENGNVVFKPMIIPTKLVDVNIGVSMQLQISNMMEFVRN